METFEEYVATIDDLNHRERIEKIVNWVLTEYPDLERVIKWNTPMFTHEGTFIIGFSAAKHHLSVSPEKKAMDYFSEQIAQAGYSATKDLFRIPWKEEVNYDLLRKIIEFNIEDKSGYPNFWRK